VGLGGETPSPRASLLQVTGIAALAAAVLWGLWLAVPALAGRWSRRRAERRKAVTTSPLAIGERRLVELGRRHGVERAASESISHFSATVAARSGMTEVADIGATLDEWRYRLGEVERVPVDDVTGLIDRLDELDRLTSA
jgi:hypothetical protein